MTKDQIKSAAAKFISTAKLTEWPQEAHNAFVAYSLKRALIASNAVANDAMAMPIVETLMTMQATMPALTANASAFRQWLQSKDVALLPASTPEAKLANRYAGLV